MFIVNCNKCFTAKTISNPNKYFISKCGHIFCQMCLPNGRCRVCKAHYMPKTIDGAMPKSMAHYFEPPQKVFRRFQKILQFQVRQDCYIANYWVNFIPKQLEEAKTKLNGMMRIDEHLSEKLEHETKRIEKLRKYLEYKKEYLDDLESHSFTSSQANPTYNRYDMDDQRLKTPTISSLSDITISSVRSSNLSNQSNSFTKGGRADFSI